VLATTLVVVASIRDARSGVVPEVDGRAPSVIRAASTADLARTVDAVTTRLAARPGDGVAVVSLAEALVRLHRVNADERALGNAEQRLRTLLDEQPNHYEAARMRAAVLIAQHRFGEAVAEANRLIARYPQDAWNHAVLGDGYMELGNYEQAFAAFDRAGALKPGPPIYARLAYALEIQGNLEGALGFMTQAAEGTSPNDPESQAWHFTQAGLIYAQLGRRIEAAREFDRALATFADYPPALDGVGRLQVAAGEVPAARRTYRRLLAANPTAKWAAAVADLAAARGDRAEAAHYLDLAEQIERAAWSAGGREPQVLARLLAEHDRDLETAVRLAEEGARRQRDIQTLDTLAWAYFKAGRVAEADHHATDALATGSRDPRLLYHASEIRRALGDHTAARKLLWRIPDPGSIGDVTIATAVKRRLSERPSLHR
jgi:tetratricopeptide (TPR) repeat protein